jgi:hypothetical protein
MTENHGTEPGLMRYTADECAAQGHLPNDHEDPSEVGPAEYPDHDCPREAFLDDPITQAYCVGSEMVHLVACPVCDAEEAGR